MSELKLLYNTYLESKEKTAWTRFAVKLSQTSVLIPFVTRSNSENLFTIRDVEGKQYFPIFSDFESIELGAMFFSEKVRFAKVSLDYICRLLVTHSSVKNVVLNPYDINLTMNKVDIESILSLRGSRKIIFGKPNEDTSVFEERLSYILQGLKAIKRVFLTKIVVQQESSYLLVIDHCSKDEKKLFETLSQEIGCHNIETALPIDFISGSTDLGKEVINSTSPFYTL